MKDQIETGVVNFIKAAAVLAGQTVDVLEGSGEGAISEFDPAIVALIEQSPRVAGNLATAELNVIVSTPCKVGEKATHTTLSRFVSEIFPQAIAPDLPVNAAHLSEHIATATGDLVTCRGYYVMRTEAATSEDRWETNLKVDLGLCYDDPAPLESVGDIDVGSFG